MTRSFRNWITVAGLPLLVLALPETAARADVLETAVGAPGQGFDLLACGRPFGGLTSCAGKGALTIGSFDLRAKSPELVGKEVAVDVTIHGAINDTLDSIILHLGGNDVRLGEGAANLLPKTTLVAQDKLDVSFTTDIDGGRYSFPGAPRANLTSVRVSVSPSTNTRIEWLKSADKSAKTIKGYLDMYTLLKALRTVATTSGTELVALVEKSQGEAVAMLNATGSGLTWQQLLYPDDWPVESRRGMLRSLADMPAKWTQVNKDFPDLKRVLTIFANVRAAQLRLRVLTPANLEELIFNAQSLLDDETAEGSLMRDMLQKWVDAGKADLADVKKALDCMLKAAEAEETDDPSVKCADDSTATPPAAR